MAAKAFIQCRVSQATKAALRAAAERQQLTESALLKRMLDLVMRTAGAAVVGDAADDRPARQARLYIRLTRDVVRHWLGVQELLRAEGREGLADEVQRFIAGMPPPRTEREWMALALTEGMRDRRQERSLAPMR